MWQKCKNVSCRNSRVELILCRNKALCVFSLMEISSQGGRDVRVSQECRPNLVLANIAVQKRINKRMI